MEYRSLPTRVRERIYLYASKTPGEWEDWEDLGLQPGDLPTGLLLGTVEIVNCTEDEYGFVWHLANPKRLKPPLRSDKHPNPMWWKPFEVYVSRPTRRTGT